MRRTTFISQRNIENWLKMEKSVILDEVIPLMVKYGLLEFRQDKGDVWTLRVSYQEFATAEFEQGDSPSHKFWSELAEKH